MRLGVYESVLLSDPRAILRMQDIAAHGFDLVLLYDSNSGHLRDLQAYLAACAAAGVQLIFALCHPVFYNGGDVASVYPAMYADLGVASTADYITKMVAAIGASPGLWGWYIGDEPDPAYHAAIAANAALLQSLDARPRLIMCGGIPAPATGYTALFQTWADCCDVLGCDFYAYQYPDARYAIGQTQGVAALLATVTTTAGIQATMTLQAFPWSDYPGHGAGGLPDAATLDQQRALALQGLGATPPLLLWYSYFDIAQQPNASAYLATLQLAASGGLPMATQKSKYFSDAILNWEAGTAMPTAPTTLYIALLTTMPTKADGTGLVEVSTTSTGYARLPITSAQWQAIATQGDNVTEKALSNIALTWTNSGGTNFGTVVGIAEYDAVTAGNLLRYATLSTGSQVINSGNVFSLPLGNLSRSES